MKRITRLLIYLLLISFNSFLAAQNIYVATNGDDTTGDGSSASPYKTFNKAVSVMSAGDVCIIKGGVYEESLIVNKNGTDGNLLTFKAADGEDVEIRATTKVNGWQLHSGSIYKADVNMGIESRFRAVYHNGDYMDLARWPNNTDNNRWTVDCTPVTGGDGSHFLANNIPNINWTGGMVYYLGAHSGTSWTRIILSSTTSRIDFTTVNINSWPFTPHNPTVWRDYPGNERGQLYLFNKLEALDHAREWFYDGGTKTLYLQTANGAMPADGTVEYARTKHAAQLQGDYIKLEGLNFFGGSVRIDNNADNNQIINCKIVHGSEGHDDLANTSAQVGEAALDVLGDNTIIKGCTIDHSSVSGINIAGWAASNCTVEGNYISNTDYLGIHASPIRTSANNMKILKNTIVNAGRDGMYVAGSNCEVAYNDVSGSQQMNSDSGVFYTVGNTSLKNSEIHHNWFHDATAPSYSHGTGGSAKAAGIYLDNDSKGYVVHHNVIWNVSWTGYQVNWNNTNLDFFHNTIWNTSSAMGSWVNGREQKDNKVYNNFASDGEWFAGNGPTEFDIKDNVISSTSPFENAASGNFMPKSGSAVIDKAQVISGFTKPFKGAAPDIGAYELGGTRWTAGVNAIEDTGEGEELSISDIQFTIAASSETCPNENNGKINISAGFAEDFVVTFNGSNTDFTQTLDIENIAPDTYDLCISIKGDSESKCFSVVIKESPGISSKSSLGVNKLSVAIETGTAPFTVTVNNEVVRETSSTSFDVAVKHGDIVKVKSSKDCEGELVESIDFFGNIQSFPNPTTGDFQFLLPIANGQVAIEIYNIQSQLVSSKTYQINSGKVDLSLSDKPSGIYFAKIIASKPINVKIIKK
ncbi:T9SS type A sorting domain-containing protein [Algibacter sp. 2305UL17-15]|uniref:T9SS type A sorting domain-containing protein n=1 Tax=Algibacter sp. 2305UL17-15 TaxID=3231268 RepID=UPI003458AF61